MIREPKAVAEFTIRSLAPLTNRTQPAKLVSKTQGESARGHTHGAAGAWYTTFMDAETPAQRAAARNTRVVHLSRNKGQVSEWGTAKRISPRSQKA